METENLTHVTLEYKVFYEPKILTDSIENQVENNQIIFLVRVSKIVDTHCYSHQTHMWRLQESKNHEPHYCQLFTIPIHTITQCDDPNCAMDVIGSSTLETTTEIPECDKDMIVEDMYSEAMKLLARTFKGRENKRIPIVVDVSRVSICFVSDQLLEDEYEGENHVLEMSMEEYECRDFPASRSSIEALERVRIEGNNNEVCVICLEEMGVGLEVRMMPCKHMFHGDCIVEWLGKMHVCPLCRFSLPIDDNIDCT